MPELIGDPLVVKSGQLVPLKHEATGISYIDIGPQVNEHSAILLIHGIGATCNYWAGVIPELSKDRRVIAMDIPGFGDSRALPRSFQLRDIVNTIFEFVRSLEIKSIDLVGHSMGGVVVAMLSAKLQSSRVVLIDAHLISLYRILEHPASSLRNLKQALGGLILLSGLIIPYRAAIARKVVKSRIGRQLVFGYLVSQPSRLDPGLTQTALARNRNRGIFRMLRTIRKADVVRAIEAIDSDLTICWGADDPLISENDTKYVERIPRLRRLIEIPRCGHWPMIEQPEMIVRIIQGGPNCEPCT